ncbi:uncharacterized protein CTHT_0048060 [Thermochaetoides thermophila DSM 1495]|uniref:Uncharacterized protein n=1 Tax=Chaetomium thermophilum (strain DSM 1495 / CBS 144.50 / IMI 039719) TaxID=759272 RepID=G0SAW8_CHATD|nr:hypothetical protein CTHT_0048060 [Thermochaetoides thermophila DSM 1495]EGS19348.1 hypothetical protein CTHT_0048060 [Thermochaetoides thermophila DSM 1495]
MLQPAAAFTIYIDDLVNRISGQVMAEPNIPRPGSAAAAGGYRTSPVPSSPRPSVASRASRSSLRKEQERQETLVQHSRPTSMGKYSHSGSPQLGVPSVEGGAPMSPTPQPIQAAPPFSPFFTLLTSTSPSTNRQTLHHPTVHYIFADDDPEILTAALAQHHRSSEVEGGNGEAGDDDSNDDSGPKDRAIIVDVEASPDGTGFEVAWASSLSPDWAVTMARVDRMGSYGDGGAALGPGGNLVLKIEGVSIEPSAGPMLGAEKMSTNAESDMLLLSSSGSTPSGGRQERAPLTLGQQDNESLKIGEMYFMRDQD